MRRDLKQLEICKQCESPTWCFITDQGPICAACRIENFFEWLYQPLGYQLLPWGREVLRDLYGAVDVETGKRRYRNAYLELGKKNGKSFLLGGLPIAHLILEADDLDNPKVFGGGAAREQASIIFDATARLIKENRTLQNRLKILPSTKRIIRRDGHGVYTVLSADGGLQDGVEPSLGLIDELHRFKTSKQLTLHQVIHAGTISQPEPLVIEITTAGDQYDSPICWDRHEQARRVLEGTIKSDRFYPRIWAINEKKAQADENYWKTREARVEANPSHEDNGGFLKDEAILSMAEELGEPGYKRYHLNIWGQKAERWMPMDAWIKCGAPTRALIGRKCWLGVDLSKTTDLTSLVFVFPDDDGSLDVLPFFWLPEDKIEDIQRRVHVDLKRWKREGLLECTPGPVIDHDALRAKIDWASEVFQLQEICYDPWNKGKFIQNLANAGYLCVEIRQGAKTLSSPMKWLLEKVLKREVRHGNHEILNWNADCVTVKVDDNGNYSPAKGKLEQDGKRIDGISALLDALFRVQLVAQPVVSVYSKPGARI